MGRERFLLSAPDSTVRLLIQKRDNFPPGVIALTGGREPISAESDMLEKADQQAFFEALAATLTEAASSASADARQ